MWVNCAQCGTTEWRGVLSDLFPTPAASIPPSVMRILKDANFDAVTVDSEKVLRRLVSSPIPAVLVVQLCKLRIDK